MLAKTFSYHSKTNSWSISDLPELDSPRTLVLAFGAPELQNKPAVFQALRTQYPSSHLVGCSTAGEICDGQLQSGSLAIAVVRFDSTEIELSTVMIRKREESLDAIRSLATKTVDGRTPSALLLLADGVLLDHQAAAQALQEVIPSNVETLVAFAGDANRFERPWVLVGDQIQSGMCVAISFYGLGLGVSGNTTANWGESKPAEYTVTKSSGNIVSELDNRPILEVCVSAKRLSPLRVVDNSGSVQHLTPVRIDKNTKAVVFHQNVPEGTKVSVLDANVDSLISGAADVARGLSGGTKTLAIAISSINRKLFLGKRSGDEVLSLASRLPADTPMLGLYSYGNVSRTGDHNEYQAQNAALSVMVFEEHDTVVSSTPLPKSRTDRIHAQNDPVTDSEISLGTPSTTGSRSLASVKSLNLDLGSGRAKVYPLESLRLIVVSGTLDERFKVDELLPQMKGRILLDLGGIQKITSFGVREWLDLMSRSDGTRSELYLANCSEVVVGQMLMVRNFAGGGQIVSFSAPYICTVCSNSFEFVLDSERTLIELRESGPPDVACPDCGNRAVFDDDPESYFDFLLRSDQYDVPGDVRDALAERRLDTMTQINEAIQKKVEDFRTTLIINRNLDEKIRWNRALMGIEGTLRMDFSGSREANEIGCTRLIRELAQISPSVNQVLLDQVPLLLVQKFAEVEPIANITIRSLTLTATCTNCGVARVVGISSSQVSDARRHGTQPEAECRRCSASIPLSIPDDVSAYFTLGAQPGGVAGEAAAPPWIWIALGALSVVLISMIAVALLR